LREEEGMQGGAANGPQVNGVPGPANLPVKNLQGLMNMEYNLQHARSTILKSFYQDLVDYRTITKEIQRRMMIKLAMVHVIEARMAMPIRGSVAMGISPPAYSQGGVQIPNNLNGYDGSAYNSRHQF